MEVNMKAICAGTKTKQEFVNETLEKYHEMYARTVSRLDVLKAVSCGSVVCALCLADIRSRSEDMSWLSRIRALDDVVEAEVDCKCAVMHSGLNITLSSVAQ